MHRISLIIHSLYFVHTCIYKVVIEFECFHCEYGDYVKWLVFMWLEEMIRVMRYSDKTDKIR